MTTVNYKITELINSINEYNQLCQFLSFHWVFFTDIAIYIMYIEH